MRNVKVFAERGITNGEKCDLQANIPGVASSRLLFCDTNIRSLMPLVRGKHNLSIFGDNFRAPQLATDRFSAIMG